MKSQASAEYLALMAFGISHLPKKSAEILPFYPHVSRVVTAARSSPGFGSIQPHLGEMVHPRFYDETCQSANLEVSQVLFLWENIESVVAFTYAGVHKEALKVNGDNNWFVHEKWPAYVAWWTTPAECTWGIGCQKLEQLYDYGSSPEAFNFAQTFDSRGHPYKLDVDRLKQYRNWYEGLPVEV